MKRATFTVSDNYHEPIYSICRGHVGLAEFKKAFATEGWNPELVKVITPEWWVCEYGGKWRRAFEKAPEAIAVTVFHWSKKY